MKALIIAGRIGGHGGHFIRLSVAGTKGKESNHEKPERENDL